MAKFGKVPAEVVVIRSLNLCAPKFVAAVNDMLRDLEGGLSEAVFETLRTNERRAYLFGFGRDYDDGRGKVTNASTWGSSWHEYGLAIDVVEKDATPWSVVPSFWNDIGEAARKNGLFWGGAWMHPDLPHVQWGRLPSSPTDEDKKLLKEKGMEAVWRKYGAF